MMTTKIHAEELEIEENLAHSWIKKQQTSMTQKIHYIINNIPIGDEIEKNHITDALRWIESGAPVFRIQKPDIPNKHLVCYFLLFDEAHEKILLVDHKKAMLWLPAGGHVETDEDPKETVKRECLEELGIEADFWTSAPLFLTSTLTVGATAGHIDVSLWYVLKGDSGASYQFDRDEFFDVCWFGFNDIPYIKSDPHIKRFINKFNRTFRTPKSILLS